MVADEIENWSGMEFCVDSKCQLHHVLEKQSYIQQVEV